MSAMAPPRLSRALSWSFLALAAAPILLLAGLITFAGYETRLEDVYRYNHQRADNLALRTGELLGGSAREILAALRAKDFYAQESRIRRAMLLEIATGMPMLRELRVMGPDGAALAAVSAFKALDHASARPETSATFRTAMETGMPAFGEVIIDPDVGEPLLPMAVPVPEPRSGGVRAVIMTTLRLKVLRDLVLALSDLPHQTALITTTGGRILASPDFSQVLAGEVFLPQVGPGVQKGSAAMPCVAASSPVRIGDQVLAAVAEEDAAHALKPFYRNLVVTAQVFVAALAAAALLAWLARRHLLSPVNDLTRTAASIHAGDLTARAAGGRFRETRAVAEAFNVMTGRLLDTKADLERQVLERARAEEALRESENRYRLLVEHARDAIYLADTEGRLVDVNPEASAQTGYSREELLAMRVADVDAKASAESFASFARELLTLRHAEFETIHRRKDGSTFPVDVHVSCFETEGKPYVLGFARDVAERRRMQEVMIQTEKMMSLGGLAAGMAHEINNPLGGILQAAQVVQRRLCVCSQANLDAAREAGVNFEALEAYLEKREVPHFLAEVRASAMRAAGIVTSMLEFSRKGDSGRTPEDLSQLLDKAVELCGTDYDLKKNYDFRRIEVVRSYAPDLPPVPCHATQVQQVFMNILRNAAQALQQTRKERPPRIEVSARAEDGMVRVDIADNGPGMPEDVRRRVFEPFYTTKDPGVGTGLGLSVSFFIVTRQHGGEIHVDSEPGIGTIFTVKLPVERRP
ncbi:Sensor protein FixL [Fundidesulfovibrio magnetotacticus]|uniref:histidine kinase n=1 Tax=Fundidesulfovibrio magnetotacticus TaxID=2730080 RepID=A0A6V8LYL2_9BACT|nr:PAS domain-containing sensor histidine kinase [Fundidesulfovibrio magnetotacticus]GFK93355.1 Sensor protein FixL [Fundidesulfovibrio magnetotacticus]